LQGRFCRYVPFHLVLARLTSPHLTSRRSDGGLNSDPLYAIVIALLSDEPIEQLDPEPLREKEIRWWLRAASVFRSSPT
jgi:hypothetical protein